MFFLLIGSIIVFIISGILSLANGNLLMGMSCTGTGLLLGTCFYYCYLSQAVTSGGTGIVMHGFGRHRREGGGALDCVGSVFSGLDCDCIDCGC